MIRLLLVASLLLITGCAKNMTIRRDYGGRVVEYAIKANKAQSVRFDGPCMSACTLYLASRNTCITRRASFHFHHPYGSTPEANRQAAAFMLNAYPAWVRDWIAANGGLTSRMIVMNYGTAVQHMRKCR